jgi:rhomboid protease GluP
MFKRQRSGSVVCPGCGSLVGVNDDRCYNCGRWNPSMWGFSPLIRSLGQDLGFVYVIMGGTIALYVVMLTLSGSDIGTSITSALSPSGKILFLFGASGGYPVFQYQRWWTIFSAGWLHAGVLHIFFNLMWVRQLGPETAELYGPGRTVIIYTVAGACGFAFSSVLFLLIGQLPVIGGAPLTVGASAPIFGLLGAQVCYSHRTGSRLAGAAAWQYAVILFFFGLIMPGIDNAAHAGGFAGGYLAARVLNPTKAERMDHVIAAVACLVITVVSLAASVVLGLPFVRE